MLEIFLNTLEQLGSKHCTYIDINLEIGALFLYHAHLELNGYDEFP